MDLSEEQIAKILNNYKNKRERENKYYHNVTKNKEDFKIKNRERAKAHYHNGYKQTKKENYNNNKELLKTKSLFNYYKRNNKIEAFKEKHENKYKMLLEKGIIQ
tara:strand:- start:192 stop:503 length:312 start_codon:yes stop_codon:yes gene_type:complete